ncbi:MAG: VanZ family protein [Clostridiales bacterium]|nr:VanZ family protein [Clostridiales bacterium]
MTENRGTGIKITGSRQLFRLFAALTGLMLLIIFGFSAMTGEVSARQSSWVQDMLAFLTGLEWDVWIIRKLAHFAEYALLGSFAALALAQTAWRPRHAFMLLGGGFVAGFLDESIQMLSHRGAAIADVWLDGFGMLCGLGFTLAFVYLYRAIRQSLGHN